MLGILFRRFGLFVSKILNYLGFQYFDVERTCCRLFQKRVVCTKFNIYLFIKPTTWTCGFYLKIEYWIKKNRFIQVPKH